MILISKITKILIQKLINFYLLYGKICFLCITFSTIVTVMLLWIKIEVNSNKNQTTVWYKPPEQEKIKFQRPEINVATIATKKVTKSLSEMMKTVPEINKDILFFNSIPKSGSEVIILLLQWLEDFNGFKHVRLPGGNVHRLSRYEQEKMINQMTSEVRDGAIPFTFDRTVYFINFTSFGQQSPTYINFIRDPIDKAIASFYYNEVTPTPAYNTKGFTNTKEKLMITTESWKTKLHYAVVREFERCVKRENPKCSYQDGSLYDLTIPYFCGHDNSCMMLNSKWALNQAKQIVERYYPVVGVLEELNATLAVLQHQLPYFFKDVSNVFNQGISDKTRRALKRPIKVLDNRVKNKLESQLTMEYEFYYFVKNRLLNQYALLQKNTIYK